MGPILVVLLSILLFGGAFWALTAGRPPSAAQAETPLNPGDLPVTPAPFRLPTWRDLRDAALLCLVIGLFVLAVWMTPKAPFGALEFGVWRVPLTWPRVVAWGLVVALWTRELWNGGRNGWRKVRWLWLVYSVFWAFIVAR